MKIGIIGGTFNPIHNGHLQMANYAITHHHLDDVFILPVGNPPHKDHKVALNSDDRYEMCLLAAIDYDHLMVEATELERKGKTYTVDTLTYYHQLYNSHNDLYYIIGGDTVLQLENWKNFEEVFKLTTFIVFFRKGIDKEKIVAKMAYLTDTYGASFVVDDHDIMEISSSEIRENIKANTSVNGWVPKRVEKYIYEHNLYK